MRLDSWTQPGLTEAQFQALFARCACGLVMTRRIFEDHDCDMGLDESGIIIDLTDSD